MADNLKLLANTITLTTANVVNNAKLVRLCNATDTAALITQKYANGATIGTVVLGKQGTNYDQEILIKQPSDTLESNAASGVYAVSIGYY